MNPLLELQERLTHSAVAGTALLEEDFRLRKIADAFAPAAQKNPVFGKIYAGLQELFQADRAQRGSLLLHLLGLVNAVLYTQADCGAEGELIPFKDQEKGEILQIRYSHLQPLLTALTTTGGGRMEILRDVLMQHPEYLCDDRVLYALIEDLNDPYSDMAHLIFAVLKALGNGTRLEHYVLGRGYRCTMPEIQRARMIRLLKRGFDPEGKADMAKRVMLVSMIAGAQENDWYRAICETAQKEVRQTAILSLGYSPENIPLLLDMVSKERGKAKEMVYYALARQDDTPELEAFWKKELEKKASVAEYLKGSVSDFSGDFAARQVRAYLEAYLCGAEGPEETEKRLRPWLEALEGKSSDGVLALYGWILDQADDPQDAGKKRFNPFHLISSLQEVVCRTLIGCCPEKLIHFLQNLPDGQKSMWKKACFFADLLTLPATVVYERWERTDPAMHACLKSIQWSGEQYCLIQRKEGLLMLEEQQSQELKEPLDVRWADVVIQNRWEIGRTTAGWDARGTAKRRWANIFTKRQNRSY